MSEGPLPTTPREHNSFSFSVSVWVLTHVWVFRCPWGLQTVGARKSRFSHENFILAASKTTNFLGKPSFENCQLISKQFNMRKPTASCITKTFKWSTAIGTVTIETCATGLHQLQMLERTPEDQLQTNAKVEVNKGFDGTIEDVHAKSVAEWLDEYFSNKNSEVVQDWTKYPNICWTGLDMTEFKEMVLKAAVEKIKFGQTVSYGELAELCGKPNAGRAVGTAMKTNPIFLIIPCHRIIRSNGATGNYSGGKLNDIKEYLLRHEGKML